MEVSRGSLPESSLFALAHQQEIKVVMMAGVEGGRGESHPLNLPQTCHRLKRETQHKLMSQM